MRQVRARACVCERGGARRREESKAEAEVKQVDEGQGLLLRRRQ